ncbi:shikimate kinase [Microvirga sp. KLBC 81]|uniref:shikimate kinase n=1 Tax=Microvirga sp. KLBC 81 TaxID=1862707 RepID=UPI000D508DC2|nr:shikimate kinase [Microvirga sp. KLBC 81]PVE20213.1 shikimate kinase [Microvirga sp. KLBC 81]
MPLSSEISAIREAVGIRSLVLIGMMGVGKTSIGKRLAARLQFPFLDTDKAVEEAAHLSVSDIFDIYGEAAFRDCERRVIARILQTPRQVVALGGGAWKDTRTRAVVEANAISIWLDADLATLVGRVQRRTTRPLLQNANPVSVIVALDHERRPIYSLADIHLKVGHGSHNCVVDNLIHALGRHLGT